MRAFRTQDTDIHFSSLFMSTDKKNGRFSSAKIVVVNPLFFSAEIV